MMISGHPSSIAFMIMMMNGKNKIGSFAEGIQEINITNLEHFIHKIF